ncbi:kinetochore-associated protein NSL1 like [Crotalus adamanteus]|uniref:Kinetochore-associated protein NSL1 like n=1 Tax=Crotalus adamanteus TaxID=8729 RepID=A0AAW1CC58_CROAD
MAAEMEALQLTGAAAGCPQLLRQEPRVQCLSRRWTAELLDHCRPFVRRLGAGQAVETENLEQAVGEALWNFETAVQENITVNGQPWQESSNLQNDTDIKLLEDQLDELIVEVASKRSQYPRKMQINVVKGIKMQQKLLGYQPFVNCQDIKVEPSQDQSMVELRLSTKTLSRHTGESFKSLSSLVERAEGFSKALSLQQTLEQCRLHQEIMFGSEAILFNADYAALSGTFREKVRFRPHDTAMLPLARASETAAPLYFTVETLEAISYQLFQNLLPVSASCFLPAPLFSQTPLTSAALLNGAEDGREKERAPTFR